MTTHRGFSAWITSEGHPLHEYSVAVDKNTNKASCWIPSDAGKVGYCWRTSEQRSDHNATEILRALEGRRIASTFMWLHRPGFVVPGRFLNGYGETWRGGVRTGPQTERPFMFAEQTSTSKLLSLSRHLAQRCAPTASGVQVTRDAGTIMLKIRLVSTDGARLANPLQKLPKPSRSQSNILSHCIR